jgi:uncharacterized membrane protein
MKNTTDTGYEIAKWLGGAAAGALLMYMLDPDRGSARRAQSAQAVRDAAAGTSSALGSAWRGAGARIGAVSDTLRDRASSLADEAATRVTGATSGSALERMGRAASEALDAGIDKAKDAIETGKDKARGMLADDGVSTGTPLDRASDALADATGGLRARMRDALHAGPGDEWTPTARNSALAGGGLLALYALTRRSPLALVLGLAGAALLARGATNQSLLGLLRGRGIGLDQTIDFSKSIHIDAAPDDVYDVWTNYENFPHFMSHVVEVRDLGRGRSHWVVRGPGGSEFEWNSVLTEQTRPHRLAWRSEAGAEIPQSGSIQFEPHRGGTRVTVRMSYTPPAGAIGHGLATLLGSDPKAQMDDDLARMKAFIERGAVPRDAARPRAGSRWLH